MRLLFPHLSFVHANNHRAPPQRFGRLQTDITRAVEESYAPRTADDVVPSRIATAFSSAEQRYIAPLWLQADQYKLVRLSEIEREDASKFFDTQVRTRYGVLCVLPLGDGSYEIVVQNSHCAILKARLD